MTVRAAIRLILDFRGPSLGDYPVISTTDQQSIVETHLAKLLGPDLPTPGYYDEAVFAPQLPVDGNGYAPYAEVVAAAAAAVEHFNALGLGLRFEPPTEERRPTCVRVEFVNGEWRKYFNYDLALLAAEPGRAPLPGAAVRVVLDHPILVPAPGFVPPTPGAVAADGGDPAGTGAS